MKKVYVVADVRGDIKLLKKLFQRIGPSQDDMLIFTGSYLGPGQDSKAVVDYLLDLKKSLPNAYFLKGCYEHMFDACIGDRPDFPTMQLWQRMGGNKVFESYNDESKMVVAIPVSHDPGAKPLITEMEQTLRIPAQHLTFFREQPLWYEDNLYPFIVTHAGGHPGTHGIARSERELLFSDPGWWDDELRRIPNKTIIFSHNPKKEVTRQKGILGIDLGAGMGGKLCCFEMYSDQLLMVE